MDTEPFLLELFFELKEIHNTWLNFFNTGNIQVELKQNFWDYIVLILPSIIAITAIIYSHKNIKAQAIMTIKKDRIAKFEENISLFMTSYGLMNEADDNRRDYFFQTNEMESEPTSNSKEIEKLRKLAEQAQKDFEIKREEVDLLQTRIKLFLDSKNAHHKRLLDLLDDWSLTSQEFRDALEQRENVDSIAAKAREQKKEITQKAKTVIEHEYENLS